MRNFEVPAREPFRKNGAVDVERWWDAVNAKAREWRRDNPPSPAYGRCLGHTTLEGDFVPGA